MQNFQNTVSPEQFAANRANAANSTGPRTTDGKARSAQNARKHGFAAAAYTVPRLEDIEEVAELRESAIESYKPANSQELYAVERIAITQQAMNRAARLEAGTFTTCLNDVLNLRERPLMEMDPDMYGGGEPGREQVKNYLLAEGFRRSVGASNVIHLCMRYSAQTERLYRRAIADFDRIKALGGAGGARDDCGPGARDFCGPACVLPACAPPETVPRTDIDQTNPNPPEPLQNEPVTPSEPAPETTPAAAPNTSEPPKVGARNPWEAPFGSNAFHYTGCICPLCLADKARLAETSLSDAPDAPKNES
jgi:hypothetical protein